MEIEPMGLGFAKARKKPRAYPERNQPYLVRPQTVNERGSPYAYGGRNVGTYYTERRRPGVPAERKWMPT